MTGPPVELPADYAADTVLVVNPDGTTGANFTGGVHASGGFTMDANVGAAPPPASDRIRWIRLSDNAIIGEVYAWDDGLGNSNVRVVADMPVGETGSELELMALAGASGSGPLAHLLILGSSSAPQRGRIVAEVVKDDLSGFLTKTLLAGDGSSDWLFAADLAYQEFTANVAVVSILEATPTDVVDAAAITLDGNTSVWVEFYSEGIVPANALGAFVITNLWDGVPGAGGVNLGRMTGNQNGPAGASVVTPAFARRKLVNPGAGQHTYNIRAWEAGGAGQVTGGLGGAGNAMPGYIRVTRA